MSLDLLIKKINHAKSIILSTHKGCDGDGLGSQLAFYHTLKAERPDLEVQCINVDSTPKKYDFLNPDTHITYFEDNPHLKFKADLALVFDTNDPRMLDDLFAKLTSNCKNLAFVDHHQPLDQGPKPTESSWIKPEAASTGEMCFDLIAQLGLNLPVEAALAIYTSIVFDTQLFRFIRNSAKTHRIVAELLESHDLPIELVHRSLFGNQTVGKVAFLSDVLGEIRYFYHGKIASLILTQKHLTKYQLNIDETRDVIDTIMNIETVEAAAVFMERAPGDYKLSLRSKGKIPVIQIAEEHGGGGHEHAAGAPMKGEIGALESEVIQALKKSFSV